MINVFISYITHEKRYSKHTIISYNTDLNQFDTFVKHEYFLSSLIEADYNTIRAWMIRLTENKIEPKTIVRKIASVKSYYKFMVKTGRLTKNPSLGIKLPKVKKRLPQYIEESNINLLLENHPFTDSFSDSRDKLIIELLYGTGIRLAELIGIKDGDIDLGNKNIKIVGKGNKERIVPIHEKLHDTISTYNKAKQFTFDCKQTKTIVTDKGLPVYPMFIQRIVRKYLSLVSTSEKKSPHILRHSFATHLLNNGADLNAIKDLMGHSSLSATQIYTHNSIAKLKDVFKKAHPKA